MKAVALRRQQVQDLKTPVRLTRDQDLLDLTVSKFIVSLAIFALRR